MEDIPHVIITQEFCCAPEDRLSAFITIPMYCINSIIFLKVIKLAMLGYAFLQGILKIINRS